MLLKSKICFTAVAIYEIIAVSVLHFQRICDAMFPVPFCDSWYRYFLFCVIVPLVAILIWMWISEFIRLHRRRKFIRRAKNTVSGIISSIRGKVSENFEAQDLEKIITAAVLIGIKRYVDRHPNIRRNVNDVIGVANGEMDIDLMDQSDEVVVSKRRTPAKKNNRSKPTAKNKK